MVPASIPAVLPSPIVSSASKSQVTSSSSKSRVTSTLVSNPSAGRRDSGASTELDMIARRSVSFHHPPVSLPASAASKVSSRAESSRRGTSTTSESSEEEASDESESTEEESTEEESEEESEEDESSDEDTPSPVARPIPPSDSRKVTVMSVPQQVTQAIVPPPLPPQRAFDVARPPQPAAKFMASAAMASGPSAPPVPSTAIRSADAGNARSSVMCGQPVFLTNTACRLQLTVSSGMQPRVMMR